MSKPQVYIFSGNDILASREAVRALQHLYIEKYSDATLYQIPGDEYDLTRMQNELQRLTQEQSLFAVKTFCLLERPFTGKGTEATMIKAIRAVGIAHHDGKLSHSTLVVWHDGLLKANHQLRQLAEEYPGSVKHVEHSISSNDILFHSELRKIQKEYEDFDIEPEGRTLVRQYLTYWDEELRLAKRIKTHEALPIDDRRYRLRSLFEIAALIRRKPTVSAALIQAIVRHEQRAVSPFGIINSVRRNNWDEAYEKFQEYIAAAGPESVFLLISLLRREYSTARSEDATRALWMLAQAELLLKNSAIPPDGLLSLFFLQQKQKVGGELISQRKAWLGSL